MGKLKRLAPYVGRYKQSLVEGSILNVISVCCAIVTPIFIKNAIDALEQGTTFDYILTCAAYLVLFAALRSVLIYAGRMKIVTTSRLIERDIRSDVFIHLTKLRTKFYDNAQTGEVTSRIINDVENIRMMVGMGLMMASNIVFMFVFATAIMFALDARLAAISLAPMMLIFISVAFVERLWYKMSQKSQEKLAEISNSAQENYSGIRVVKAFAREESEIDRFRSLAEGYKKINTDFAWLRGRYLGFLTLSAELGIVVMLIIGGSWVINGTLTKGTLMAFTAYLFMLIWPMIAMGWLITLIQRGLSCLDRIIELLDMPPEPDGSDQVEKINEIEIRDLTFAYDARPVLRNVNAVIRAGERVAIVGKTGCGKTTLANLLLRMYEPPKGSILINGRDINSISLENIRGMVSMVPQDSFLFQDTVSENIRFGAKNGISEEKINYFSNLSRIAQDVETFPLRYSQLIGERGVVLSGGQKQRLSITRAIAREPQVLILDDAFSNIDSNTEKDLLSGLLRDLKDRTIILITHRFSSVKEMDRILVMSDGQIVEDGSHEELIDKKGRYFTMFEKYNLTREIQEA